MTLAELRIKYKFSGGNYEPNPNCRFCKGAGERPVKREPGRMTFCICLFVAHEASDEIGVMIGKAATEALEKLRKVL